jgi:hypothetical protein
MQIVYTGYVNESAIGNSIAIANSTINQCVANTIAHTPITRTMAANIIERLTPM